MKTCPVCGKPGQVCGGGVPSNIYPPVDFPTRSAINPKGDAMALKRYEVIDERGQRTTLKLSEADRDAIVARGGTVKQVSGTDAGASTKKRSTSSTRTK